MSGCVGPYITRFSAWAPGVEAPGEWDEWALGRREIHSGPEGPEIAYTAPVFRRRLSQISRMTIQVVHDLLPLGEDTKMIFLSFRGELLRQYKIDKMLIEDKSIMPSDFSFSVFNAPAALASIAFGLKGGYSALYPGGNSFAAGLAAAEAALPHGVSGELAFVYADEEVPPEYRAVSQGSCLPLAFGFLFSRESGGPSPESGAVSIPLSALKGGEDSPEVFLKSLLLYRKTNAPS